MIRRIYIDRDTDEWYEFRKSGIGSSEIGTLVGLSQYQTPAKIFYQKIGVLIDHRVETAPMFHGKLWEGNIGGLWKYYDGQPDQNDGDYNGPTYMANFYAKKKFRDCRAFNCYVVNDKYPYMFVSPDFGIFRGQPTLYNDGSVVKSFAPLEVKTINARESAKWETGIPPSYLAQVHSQMIVLESDYAEIALYDNYGRLSVHPITINKAFAQQLIARTNEFFEKQVLPARIIAKEQGYTDFSQSTPAEIQLLEPPPDSSEAYLKFMKQRYKDQTGSIPGDEEQYELVRKTKHLQAAYKHIESMVNLNKNTIRSFMKTAESMSFDDKGRVDNKFDVKGVRSLNIYIKDKPDPKKVAEQVELLNTKI